MNKKQINICKKCYWDRVGNYPSCTKQRYPEEEILMITCVKYEPDNVFKGFIFTISRRIFYFFFDY